MKFKTKQDLVKYIENKFENKVITGEASLIIQNYFTTSEDVDTNISAIDDEKYVLHNFIKCSNLEKSLLYFLFVEKNIDSEDIYNFELIYNHFNNYYLERRDLSKLKCEINNRENLKFLKDVRIDILNILIGELEEEYGL